MSIETAFNERAWRKISPQLIGPQLPLPQEFYLARDMQDAARFAHDASLSFSIAPFVLTSAMQSYVASISVAETDNFPSSGNNEVVPRTALPGRHYYDEREFNQRANDKISGSPLITKLQQALADKLPERAGKAELIDGMVAHLFEAQALLGETRAIRLSFSLGWMPHPKHLKPHHDINLVGQRNRAFSVLLGKGPLVVPTTAFTDTQRRMYRPGMNEYAPQDSNGNSGYPEFVHIDPRHIYQLDYGYTGIWRTGAFEPVATNRPLPHAVPPFRSRDGGMRAILVADYKAT